MTTQQRIYFVVSFFHFIIFGCFIALVDGSVHFGSRLRSIFLIEAVITLVRHAEGTARVLTDAIRRDFEYIDDNLGEVWPSMQVTSALWMVVYLL